MEKIAQMLKEYGLKATFQRMNIVDVIHKMGHADVDEIYQEVIKTHPTLSLATVYKNVLVMVEKGALVEVPIAGKKSKFEIKKEDHFHLICTECGMVVDKELDNIVKQDTEKLAKYSGFDLHARQLNLYGVCDTCHHKKAS